MELLKLIQIIIIYMMKSIILNIYIIFITMIKYLKKYHFLMIGYQMLLKMNLNLKVLILHQ